MHDLEITWPDGSARFTPDDSPVTIGRAPDSSVVLTDPSISRRHIEFTWNGTAWTAQDHSTHGSFDPIGVRLAPTWTVGINTSVRLGGIEGTEVRIELVTTRPRVAAPASSLLNPPEPEAPPRPPSLEDFVSGRAQPVPATPAPPVQPSRAATPAPTPAPPAPPAPLSLDPAQSLPPAPPAAPPPPASGAPWPGPASAPPPADAPSAFDAAPAPPSAFDQPAGFGAPPAPPSAFDQPAGFSAPPAPPSAFDQPVGGPAVAPPPPPAPAFDQPAAFDPLAGPTPPPAPTPPPGPAPAAPWNGDEWAPEPAFDRSWPPGGPDPAGPAPTLHHLAAATAVSDATISLSIDGRDYTFLPGTEITVGRDPSCLVTVDERHSLVSRRHLVITHHDGAWWIDDTSTKGTFIDGRRISGPVRAEGAFLTQLGDDDAGLALRIITAGEHRVKRSRNIPLLAAIAVLAAVAVGALVLALQNRGSTPTVAAAPDPAAAASAQEAADLAAAKHATVMLLNDKGLGSGFFVSDRLIVTNQHVAALGETLYVAVSRDVDKPAKVEYKAQTIARHPYLDIAVMRITSDAKGGPVTTVGLAPVKIGDSTTLTLGDPVYSTGFPAPLSLISANDMGQLRLPPVSATRGVAASFAIWPGCSNPSKANFIPVGSPPGVKCSPTGDVESAVVITTFSSGPGASGSPVFKGSTVVGVVFAGPDNDPNAGRNVATSAFNDWLQQTITANS